MLSAPGYLLSLSELEVFTAGSSAAFEYTSTHTSRWSGEITFIEVSADLTVIHIHTSGIFLGFKNIQYTYKCAEIDGEKIHRNKSKWEERHDHYQVTTSQHYVGPIIDVLIR